MKACFPYLDLGGTWHGRGQRLCALTTSQTDLPPRMHSSDKAGLLKVLHSSGLDKVVNPTFLEPGSSSSISEVKSETKALTENYKIKIFK